MTTDAADEIEAQGAEEQRSGRQTGLIAMLAILTVVGLAIWLLANQDDES